MRGVMQEFASKEEWQVTEMEYDDDPNEFDGFNTHISKENRLVVVKTIDGSLIRGNINLNSETLPMDRVSDLLIKGQTPPWVIEKMLLSLLINRRLSGSWKREGHRVKVKVKELCDMGFSFVSQAA